MAAEYNNEQIVGDYTAWVLKDGDTIIGAALGLYTGNSTEFTVPSTVTVKDADGKEIKATPHKTCLTALY